MVTKDTRTHRIMKIIQILYVLTQWVWVKLCENSEGEEMFYTG